MAEERCWNDLATRVHELEAENARLRQAARRALNFIVNTESELGITLDSGEALRAAIGQTHTQEPFERTEAPS